MLRPFLSYALTAILLLSQAGLPVHMHYCKGILETVSVFFNLGCKDRQESGVANLLAATSVTEDGCCKASSTTIQVTDQSCCHSAKSKCCDDEVAVLLHEFDSLLPHFEKWDADVIASSFSFREFRLENILSAPSLLPSFSSDGGPPLYILNGSLIFYA